LQQLTSDYPAATATLAEAIGLFRDLGDLPGQAYALNHLGLVQVDMADYPAAAASHRQALALARDAGDQLAEAVSLIDLGLVQQMTGDYQAAAASYEQALPLARSVGSAFDEADALCELGAVQRLTGDYPAAIASEHQALDLFGHLGDRLGQAWALDELGLVHQLTGDYQIANACLAEAIELFRDLGDRHGLAKALNSLGELSLRTSAPKSPAAATHRRSLSPVSLAHQASKHGPWKESAAAFFTETPLTLPRTCGKPWRSIRRSERPTPGACGTRSTPSASDKREARPQRIPRSLRPLHGHAPTVVLDKGDAASGSGHAVEQGLSVQQDPQPVPCPVATATPATRCRSPAIGRAYPRGSPDLGNSHRVCPPMSSG
jgi:hypothetical protein